jgi:hypothetical protein
MFHYNDMDKLRFFTVYKTKEWKFLNPKLLVHFGGLLRKNYTAPLTSQLQIY